MILNTVIANVSSLLKKSFSQISFRVEHNLNGLDPYQIISGLPLCWKGLQRLSADNTAKVAASKEFVKWAYAWIASCN